MHKIIGVLLLALAAGIIVLKKDALEYQFSNLPQRFKITVQRDLDQLLKEKKISPAFFSPRGIKYQAHTPLTKALVRHARPLQRTDRKGKLRLEIDLHEWEQDGELGVTVSFNVFEAEGDNKIDEFGRTYILLQKPGGS